MTEEIATQFKTEGQPAFPVTDTENANSAASSTGEQTNTEQTQSQGGEQTQAQSKDGGAGQQEDGGLLDHPRWKEREADWTKRFNDQEARHVEELQKLREEITAKIGGNTQGKEAQAAATITPGQVPSWFGGDEQQWAEFQQWNNGLLSQAKAEARSEALDEIKSKSEAEQKAIDEATTYMNTEITAIESDKELNPKGEKIDRNKLFKIAHDFKLVDTEGRWNWRAAYLISKNQFTSSKNASTEERKAIANATISDNRGETKPAPYATSADFSKPGARPW